MVPPLIACPGCHHHTRARHSECDHCGGPLRSGGSVPQTAAALALGLSLAASACSEATPVYGAPAVAGNSSSAAAGGAGGEGGAGGTAGDGGAEPTPDYGVPGVGGGG